MRRPVQLRSQVFVNVVRARAFLVGGAAPAAGGLVVDIVESSFVGVALPGGQTQAVTGPAKWVCSQIVVVCAVARVFAPARRAGHMLFGAQWLVVVSAVWRTALVEWAVRVVVSQLGPVQPVAAQEWGFRRAQEAVGQAALAVGLLRVSKFGVVNVA